MIRYELTCRAGHSFEGWFRSSQGFEEQQAAGELSCPVCADTGVAKAMMAPALAKSRAPVDPRQMLRALRREVEAKCENVGSRFAEEARKIHSGEAEARGIYGDATATESEALADEGIPFARIPWVPATDG